MFAKFYIARLVFVILFLVFTCGCEKLNTTKFKRKVDFLSTTNKLQHALTTLSMNDGSNAESRGFLPHGGLFSLGKVLNFFPVGGERECQPTAFTIARAGICLNPYDCRQRDGKASGDCAHGLGVCCVFEVTCGGVVQNNLTYFKSPGFPELWTGEANCSVQIEKTHAGIIQLRIDFVHFTIGQPNRTTGDCDEDNMILGEGAANFTLCGQNHGQHIYYTLPSGSETRESGELPHAKSTPLVVTMRGGDTPRLWLIRIAQMPLAYSSPHNCLQYFNKDNGTIKTFNYASNGRHLAGQEYRACVRRNAGFCSVRYSPCDRRSFRIGPRGDDPVSTNGMGPGAYGGAGPGYYGPDGLLAPAVSTSATMLIEQRPPTNDMNMMPADDQQNDDQNDEQNEGSGADPQIVDGGSTARPSPAIWSYIFPWGSQSRTFSWARWSPYMQHYSEEKLKYYGYGGYGGYGSYGHGRQRCTDRVTIPCENEYFVSSSIQGSGVCDPHHCGNTLCPGVRFEDCRVESSITPFAVSVYFGPPTAKHNPEDNIGMCLQYTQIPCDS